MRRRDRRRDLPTATRLAADHEIAKALAHAAIHRDEHQQHCPEDCRRDDSLSDSPLLPHRRCFLFPCDPRLLRQTLVARFCQSQLVCRLALAGEIRGKCREKYEDTRPRAIFSYAKAGSSRHEIGVAAYESDHSTACAALPRRPRTGGPSNTAQWQPHERLAG